MNFVVIVSSSTSRIIVVKGELFQCSTPGTKTHPNTQRDACCQIKFPLPTLDSATFGLAPDLGFCLSFPAQWNVAENRMDLDFHNPFVMVGFAAILPCCSERRFASRIELTSALGKENCNIRRSNEIVFYVKGAWKF